MRGPIGTGVQCEWNDKDEETHEEHYGRQYEQPEVVGFTVREGGLF